MSNGNQVDSSSCTVSAVTSQTITPTTTNTFIIGNPNILSISWQTQSPLTTNDIIILTLPINYISYYNYIGTVLTYDSGNKVIQRSISTNSTQQVIYNITSLSDSYISANNIISINNLVITCLIDISIRYININIIRNGYNIENGNLAITPTNNILSNISINGDIKIV
mgnify:CR=1 FL=1|jgi:hypothetical protein